MKIYIITKKETYNGDGTMLVEKEPVIGLLSQARAELLMESLGSYDYQLKEIDVLDCDTSCLKLGGSDE